MIVGKNPRELQRAEEERVKNIPWCPLRKVQYFLWSVLGYLFLLAGAFFIGVGIDRL
jgi:hypothetical protein